MHETEVVPPTPLRILLVTHYYSSHRGGVEILAHSLALQLKQRYGIQITWIASGIPSERAAIDAVTADGIFCVPAACFNTLERLIGVPYPIWYSPRDFLRMWQLIRSCDVVHLHDCLYMGNIVAFIFAKCLRQPVLVTQHIGLVPYRNLALRMCMSWANAIVAKTVLYNADRVVAYSRSVMEYFKLTDLRHADFIANGVDDKHFHFSNELRTEIRSTCGFASEEPVVLFVGRFVEKKGLEIVRHVARMLPHVRFVLCGWGPVDPCKWSAENVNVIGACDRSGVHRFYCAADLLFLPSVGEGFPVVVQEAMSCGLRALVSSAVADAQPEAKEFLFCEEVTGDNIGDANRFATRIKELLADLRTRDSREAVAAAARALWSVTRCSDRYFGVLSAIADGKCN